MLRILGLGLETRLHTQVASGEIISSQQSMNRVERLAFFAFPIIIYWVPVLRARESVLRTDEIRLLI